MISVLLPSRGRPDLLFRAASSCFETAWLRSGDVELVLRIDDDDPLSKECASRLWRAYDDVQVIVGPRLDGYGSLLRFMNECAAAADGDLLMTFNDDGLFRTLGWNERIEAETARFHDGICNIATNSLQDPKAFPNAQPFSVVTRRWVELLGFLFDPM